MHKAYKQKLFFLLTLLLASPHVAHASIGTLPNRCFHKKPLPHLKQSPRSYFVAHYRVSSYLALQKSQKTTSLFAQSRNTIFPWGSLSYPIKKQTAYISYLSFANIRPNHPLLTSSGGYYYGQKRLQGDIYKPTTNTGLANITASVEVIRPPMGATAAALQFASTTVDFFSERQKATNLKIEGQEKRATMMLAHEQEKEIEDIKHIHQHTILASAVKAKKDIISHAQATQQQIDHTQHQQAKEMEAIKHIHQHTILASEAEAKKDIISHAQATQQQIDHTRHQHAKEIEEVKHIHQQTIIASEIEAKKDIISHAQTTQQQIDHTRHQHATELLQKQYNQEAHRKDEDTLKINLPRATEHSFVARPEILTQLKQYFTSEKASQSNQYVTLHGWIGSGKTSLAKHYGSTHLRKPYAMVWWIDATSAHTIEKSLKDICVKLGGENARTDKSMEEIHKELQIQMSKVSNKPDTRWLVIWDNVNTNSLQAFKNNDSPNNYPSVGGDILITTRDFTLREGPSILVNRLTGDEATALFCQYETPIDKEKDELTQLINTTNSLPLALSEAGTYIINTHSTLSDYIAERKEMTIDWNDYLGKVANYSQNSHLQKEVKASLKQATQIAPEATKLMGLLAYYDYAHLSKKVLLQAIIPNKHRCNKTIQTLQQQGLLYRNPATRCLETHPAYQYLLRSQDQAHAYEHLKEADTILRTLWESEPQHHELLTPHVHACACHLMEAIHSVTYASAKTDTAATASTASPHPFTKDSALPWFPLIQTIVSHYLHQQSPALEKALDLLEPTKLIAENHPEKPYCAQLYAHFGYVFILKAAYEKAIEAYQKALEYAPKEIQLYHALADCYLQKNAWDLVDKTYQQCLALEKEKEIAPSKDTGLIAFGLAQHSHKVAKDNTKAIERYQQGLQAEELPQDMKMQAHLNIAFLYAQEGLHQEAVPHYQIALTCLESTADNPELLIVAHQGLGLGYHNQQQYTKAVTHLYTAWEQATQCWGKEANDTLTLWDSFLSAQTALLNEDLDRLPDEHVQQVLWRAVRHAQQAASPSIAARNSIQILCRAGHKDFSSQDLSNFDLRELDLKGIHLTGAQLPQDLSGINFTAAKLPQNLHGINFTGAKLPQNLSQHSIQRANLSHTDLVNVTLPQDLRGIDFTGAKLPKDLSQHSLQGTNLSNIDLVNAKLPKDLSYVDFTETRLPLDLRGIDFTGAKLPQDLLQHSLQGTNLSNIDLVNVTLPQNLRGIDFTGAKLPQDLSQHSLQGTNLSNIDLVNAKLPKDLSYVDFTETRLPLDLRGIDFTAAKLPQDLSQHNLQGANLSKTDLANVTLPLDLHSPLTGHTKKVISVALTTDNKYIISGSADKTIRIWDLNTGKEVSYSPLKGHQDWVRSVVVTTDNKYIVSGSVDNTIRIWDLKTGKEVSYSPLKSHTHYVNSVSVTTDNKYIVSSSYDKTIRIWGLNTGKEVSHTPLKDHTSWVTSVAITTDNKYIVSGSYDKNICIWDLNTGKEVKHSPLKGHTSWVKSVAVTTDNKYIVSGSADSTIRIWDLNTGKEVNHSPLKGHTDWVRSVAVTNDNKYIVSGSYDTTIRIWALNTGKEVTHSPLKGHTDWVRSVAVTTDNKYIVSGSYDKTIRIWDLNTGKETNNEPKS